MRHRPSWIQIAVFGSCLALAAAYSVLALVIPPWARGEVQRLAGDRISVGRIHLGFPLRLVLADVRLKTDHPAVSLSSRRIVIGPVWYAWPKRLLWIKAVECDGVTFRIHRTPQGTLLWPMPQALGMPGSSTAVSPAPSVPAPVAPSVSTRPLDLFIQTIGISDGTIELLDEKLPTPFRGSLSEISLVGGPVAIPSPVGQISVAVSARVTGHGRHTAAVFCSGWVSLEAGNMDVSCQLEPLPLAAFAPYYEEGPIQLRVSDATVQARIHLAAKANALDGRIQLEIANLSDPDLAKFGRTLADVKGMADEQRRLTGEIQFSGSLSHPEAWEMRLVPGNDIVQRLVAPLVHRGIDEIQIKVGKQTIAVGLTPGSDAAASTVAATAKSVEDNLQLLAPKPAESAAEVVPAPAASPSAEASALPSASPSATVSPLPSPAPSPAPSIQPAVAQPAEIQ